MKTMIFITLFAILRFALPLMQPWPRLTKKARLSKKEAVEILTSIARGEIRENNILVETRERGNGKETSKISQKMQNTTRNRDRLRAVELMAKMAQWDQPEDKEEPIQYFFERDAADDTKN